MTEKTKQDKGSATSPPDSAEAGNPLCPDGEVDKITDNRARRYIRITDTESWAQIDKISQDERYSKSFNKIINDALFYGLPILTEKLFGEVEEEPRYVIPPKRKRQQEEGKDEEYNATIVKLLKEIVLNEAINKSILSSLFHAMEYWSRQCDVPYDEYSDGRMSETPEYLQTFEAMGIRNLRR